MADTVPNGTQTTEPVVNAMNAPIPAPTTAPAEATPTPQAPGGRSVEELFNEMQELKRFNAELAERAARAEHEATYTRNLVDTFRQGEIPRQAPTQATPEISDDEFLQNPGKATAKYVSSMFEKERAEREQKERMAYVERAKSLYETGRTTAKDKLGKLLSGIETDVANYIQQGIISGNIDPDAATDPDLWAATAIIHRYKTGKELDFSKYLSDRPAPMAAGHQETPTVSAPTTSGPVLSDADRAYAQFFKMTPEQWAAAKAKEGIK